MQMVVMYGTFTCLVHTHVKCTFTPHPNLEYFIYFNVRCTKLGVQVRYHIVWNMIPLMLLKSHQLIFWFSCLQ